MFQFRRSQLHYWSRHRPTLKRLSLGLVAGGFALAWLLVLVMPAKPMAISADPTEQAIRNVWQRLHHSVTPQPRECARWLRLTLAQRQHLADVLGLPHTTWESYQQDGRVAGYEIEPLLRKHFPEGPVASPARDFVVAHLADDQTTGREAGGRLQESAESENPPPLANEFHAALLAKVGNEAEALQHLLREGRLFPDATEARTGALRLALKLQDKDVLSEIAQRSEWLEDVPPLLLHQLGAHVGDFGLQFSGLLRHRVQHLPFYALLPALFVTLLWYVILILHGPKISLRWLLPIAPLIAGIFSVWPALAIANWQEMELGMSAAAPFPQDLWFFLGGVGLREEVAKLALFAFFLPVLLRWRVPGVPAITGAFVGLGFAFEENLDYYQEFGGAIALVRFLTANFLHAALTGIAAHSFYEMIRTRFAEAEKFIFTFAGVVAAHGLYNWLAGLVDSGLDILSMILLAFIAWHFLDLLQRETPRASSVVSPAAVFLLGSAALIAMVFLLTAVQVGTMEGLTASAAEALSILPMALIYWRRFA